MIHKLFKTLLIVLLSLLSLSNLTLGQEKQEKGELFFIFQDYRESEKVTNELKVAELSIEIEPENFKSLTSTIPKFFPLKNAPCVRVPFEWISLKSVSLNGEKREGQYQIKNTGLCKKHWVAKVPSFQIRVVSGEKINGLEKIKLNSLNADPYFFEIYASRLFSRSGGISTQAGLVNLFVNGKYSGLREVVEILNDDFLNKRGLNKGVIYKERTMAHIGDERYFDNNIKAVWEKKTSLGDLEWKDLSDFNRSVYFSILKNEKFYQDFLSIESFINYYSMINVIGTNANNYHNIPIYRPRDQKKFIPIGDDFSGSWQSYFSDHFSGIHIPMMVMNWPNELIWQEASWRKKIYSRMTQLLPLAEETYTEYRHFIDQLKELIQLNIELGYIQGIKSFKQYWSENIILKFLKRRIEFLKENYQRPIVRIENRWKEQRKFQMMIEGHGLYHISFSVEEEVCNTLGQRGGLLKIKDHFSSEKIINVCESKGKGPIVERNEITSPNIKSKFEMKRMGLGPLFIQIEKLGDFPLAGIRVTSLQTKRNLPIDPIGVTGDNLSSLPFQLKKIRINGKQGLEISSPLKFLSSLSSVSPLDKVEGWSILNVNPHALSTQLTKRPGDHHSFALVVAPDFKQESNLSQKFHLIRSDFGPLVCWNIKGRKNCFELTKEFLINHHFYEKNYFKENHQIRPQLTIIDNQKIKNCREFYFHHGRWAVTEPLIFDEECKVHFSSGAKIGFHYDAYIIIKGEVAFPEQGPPVEFAPDERSVSQSWGGMVLFQNKQKMIVKNAIFRQGSEFFWKNRKFTGVLNLINPKEFLISNNIFEKNMSENGIFIGHKIHQNAKTHMKSEKNTNGESELLIKNNLFINNIDAIEIQKSPAEVEIRDNRIELSSQNNISLVKTKAKILGNSLAKAGNSCLSINGSSEVHLTGNLVDQCNIGIFAENDSKIQLSKNIFSGNYIALATKNDKNDLTPSIKGESTFMKNQVNFNVNGYRVHDLKGFDRR